MKNLAIKIIVLVFIAQIAFAADPTPDALRSDELRYEVCGGWTKSLSADMFACIGFVSSPDNIRCNGGETYLTLAMYHDQLLVAKNLLEAKADPNLVANGGTALHATRSKKGIQLLRKFGATGEHRKNYGGAVNLVHYAIKHGRKAEVVATLCEEFGGANQIAEIVACDPGLRAMQAPARDALINGPLGIEPLANIFFEYVGTSIFVPSEKEVEKVLKKMKNKTKDCVIL